MAVKLTQMIRKGTVCHVGKSRIAMRFSPTNPTHATSTQYRLSVRTARSLRIGGIAGRSCVAMPRLLGSPTLSGQLSHRDLVWTGAPGSEHYRFVMDESAQAVWPCRRGA